MPYETIRAVDGVVWGQSVGRVALNPQTGFYAFAYAPEWIANALVDAWMASDAGITMEPSQLASVAGV